MSASVKQNSQSPAAIYADIIDLPYNGIRSRPPMPRLQRAAQFAAFDALSGYKEAIDAAAREWAKKAE